MPCVGTSKFFEFLRALFSLDAIAVCRSASVPCPSTALRRRSQELQWGGNPMPGRLLRSPYPSTVWPCSGLSRRTSSSICSKSAHLLPVVCTPRALSGPCRAPRPPDAVWLRSALHCVASSKEESFPATWPSEFSHKNWIRFPRGGYVSERARTGSACQAVVRAANTSPESEGEAGAKRKSTVGGLPPSRRVKKPGSAVRQHWRIALPNSRTPSNH